MVAGDTNRRDLLLTTLSLMLQRFSLRRAHLSASVSRHVRAAHTESNVLKELESRGLVSQVSR